MKLEKKTTKRIVLGKWLKGLTILLSVLYIDCSTTYAQLIAPGTIAPDFTVTDANGGTHHLYEYLDQGKYVVLKFGWVGCGSCDVSRPSFNASYRNLGCNLKDVIFLELELVMDNNQAHHFVDQLISVGHVMDGQSGVEDSLYQIPDLNMFITTEGGSESVDALYHPSSYPSDVIIEPVGKTILGTSEPEGSSNMIEGLWPTAFASMYTEGYNDGDYGKGFLQAMLIEKPNLFHNIPVLYYNNYVSGFLPHPATATPFAEFCDGSLNGCDVLKPLVTSTNVVSDSGDSTYTITVNWSSPGGACNNYEVVLAGMNEELMIPNLANVQTTSSTTMSYNGLHSGSYQVMVRCICNNVYGYEVVNVEVEPQTDFTIGTNCQNVCQYTLYTIDSSAYAMGIYDGWIFDDISVRLESEGNIEFYTYTAGESGWLNGVFGDFESFPIQVCQGSELKLSLYNHGFDYGNGAVPYPVGFRLIDADGATVSEHLPQGGMQFLLPPFPVGYPGHTDYGPFQGSCSSAVGIDETQFNQLVFSPNPSNGSFNLTSQDGQLTFDSIVVIDCLGRNIPFKTTSNGEGINIDVQTTISGTYFINIKRNGVFKSFKVGIIK